MRPQVLVLGLFDDIFRNAVLLCLYYLVNKGIKPELGLSHLASAVCLNRIDGIFSLLLIPCLMTLQAGFLQLDFRGCREMRCIGLSCLFILDFWRMAVITPDSCLCMFRIVIGLCLRVLPLPEEAAGKSVPEVKEVDFIYIMIVEVKDILVREMVCPTVSHGDFLSGLCLCSWITVVFHMALSALKACIIFSRRAIFLL